VAVEADFLAVEELFNLQHSSLRNVIERTFGVFNRCFKIMANASEYKIEQQYDLVLLALASTTSTFFAMVMRTTYSFRKRPQIKPTAKRLPIPVRRCLF
jgi:hypothetical protein